MKPKLSIVVSGNKDYFTKEPYAPIKALQSFRNNFGDNADYFCICDDDSESINEIIHKNGFKLLHSDKLKKFDKEHHGHPGGNFPSACCYLFLAHELMFELGYEYTLCVDGDVYCNSVFKLPNNLKSFHFAGLHEPPKNENSEINTGIIFFNNSKCVQDNLLNGIMHLYKSNEYSSDQQLFNDLISKGEFKLLELHYTYHIIFRVEKMMKMSDYGLKMFNCRYEDAKMVHFVRGKPWLNRKNSNYPIKNHFASLYNNLKIET
jgi:hypothetical protein